MVAKHGAAPEGVLGAGSDPRSCPHTPQPQGELGRHLLILGGWEWRAPTLALCMVKRSTPVPVTLMLETSDRKLKEMVTGLRRHAKSVERHRREVRLHLLAWPCSPWTGGISTLK